MKLRLPDDLKARIEQAASDSGRSLNSEIVFRLEQSFGSVEEFILRNRIAELDQLGKAIARAKHTRDDIHAEMESVRGPGTTERRRELLTLFNRQDKHVRELQHYWQLLDSDITAIRSGNLLTVSSRPDWPASGS